MAVVLMASAGCAQDAPVPVTEIVTVVGADELQLGDLQTAGVAVQVPANSFEAGTELALSHGGLSPEPEQDFSVIGGTLDVKLGSVLSRSEKDMRIEMLVDLDGIGEPGEVFVGYHHPDYGWRLLVPDEVDLATGRVVFTTNHFSSYTGVRASEQRRVEEFVSRQATEEYVRSEAAGGTSEQVTAMVEAILRDGLGVSDSRVLEIVTRAVIEKVPGGKIGLAIHSLDADQIAQATLDETLLKVVEVLSEEGLDLSGLSSVSGLAAVAGAASAGDYTGAAKMLGEEVVGNLPVIGTLKSLGETASVVAEHVINDLWMNPAMQKAYEAYRSGASSGYFGYEVDPGDWDELTRQMGAVARNYQTAHVTSWAEARGIDPDSLDEDEWNRIAAEGMDQLKERWDARIVREPVIAQTRTAYEELFTTMEQRGLLERAGSNPMWGEQADFEVLLRRAVLMVERVKSDTGRTELVLNETWEGRGADTMISTQAIADLLREWYSSPAESREQNYRNRLVELGLMEADKAEAAFDPSGSWTGTLTNAGFEPAPETVGNDLRCGSSAGLPITVPLTLQVTALPDGAGAVTTVIGGASCRVYPDGWDKFSSVWEANDANSAELGGSLTWTRTSVSFSLPGGFSFTGSVSADGASISGEFVAELSYGRLSGRWTVTRP